MKLNLYLRLTAFLTKETNPYPLDLSVCGSLTTLQSLQQETSSFVKNTNFSVTKEFLEIITRG